MSSVENQADLETNQQATFECDQCDAVLKTRNGLKIHIGKSHKEAPNSPKKLRDTSSELLLNVSPTRDHSRVEPYPNCGGTCPQLTSARKMTNVLLYCTCINM